MLLKELYPVKPVCKVAKTLGRTIPSIQHKAYSLGVKTRRYVEKLRTAEELELLKKLYPTSTSSREVADKIERPWGGEPSDKKHITLALPWETAPEPSTDSNCRCEPGFGGRMAPLLEYF